MCRGASPWASPGMLHHIRAAPEVRPDLLSPPQGPVHLVLALALVAKVVAVPAQEILTRPVQDRLPPAAPEIATNLGITKTRDDVRIRNGIPRTFPVRS